MKPNFSILYQAGEFIDFSEQSRSWLNTNEKAILKWINESFENQHTFPFTTKIQLNNLWYELHVTKTIRPSGAYQLDFSEAYQQDFKGFLTDDLLFAFLNQSPNSLIIFNEQAEMIFCNPVVESYFGLSREEIDYSELGKIGVGDSLISKWTDTVQRVIDNKSSQRMEFQMPDGLWIDWHLVPYIIGSEKYVFAYSHEISRQKEDFYKERLKQEYLIHAFEIANLATWEMSINSMKIQLNKQLCNLFGIYDSSRFENDELFYIDFINDLVFSDDQKAVEAIFQQESQFDSGSSTKIFEFRILHQESKEQKTFLMTINQQTNDEHQKLLYGTFQDISYLKSAEGELEKYRNELELIVRQRTEALIESENKLNDALSLARLGTWSYDFKLDLFTFAGVVPKIMGIDNTENIPSELSLDEFKNFIYPDDWPTYYKAALKAVKSLDKNYLDYVQYRVITPKGDIRNLQVSVKVEFNELTGEHTRHYGTIQDITNIRQKEHENKRLTEIIEATPDIVAVFNVKQGVEYLNKSARHFYDVDEKADVKKLSLYDLAAKKEINDIRKFIKIAVRKGTWSGEYTYLDYEGKEKSVSQVIIAHKNFEGHVEYISTILRDISDHKAVEKNLIYKNHELDTFVYRASHDLRGPITSLFGLINVAKYDVSDQKAKVYMDMFEKQVVRLNTIIGNLMELTKIKEKELDLEVINFDEMISDIISSFANLNNFQKIAFQVEVDKNLNFVGDSGIILTILQNLIENGIKYAREDVDSQVRIQIKRFVPNDSLHIKVSDNGMGIDEDFQDKIFNMFFRATESATGTGLGLYILKNAVERLGGSIKLNSRVNSGSAFSVFIPY